MDKEGASEWRFLVIEAHTPHIKVEVQDEKKNKIPEIFNLSWALEFLFCCRGKSPN